MDMKIGRKVCRDLADFATASALYGRLRDESGLGASRWPNGLLYENGEQIAYISYNGRVWAGVAYDPDVREPIYEVPGRRDPLENRLDAVTRAERIKAAIDAKGRG